MLCTDAEDDEAGLCLFATYSGLRLIGLPEDLSVVRGQGELETMGKQHGEKSRGEFAALFPEGQERDQSAGQNWDGP